MLFRRGQWHKHPRTSCNRCSTSSFESSETKTGAGGTGLELAICREIVEAHGGKIWAENRNPKGVMISFMIARNADQHAR